MAAYLQPVGRTHLSGLCRRGGTPLHHVPRLALADAHGRALLRPAVEPAPLGAARAAGDVGDLFYIVYEGDCDISVTGTGTVMKASVRGRPPPLYLEPYGLCAAPLGEQGRGASHLNALRCTP